MAIGVLSAAFALNSAGEEEGRCKIRPTSVCPFALHHLRHFLAAAEHGSFRKAAAALGVQESSISRRIRDLEDQLGASLFQRHNGGVRLTFAGQRFRRQAEEILRHMRDSANDVAAIGRAEIRTGLAVARGRILSPATDSGASEAGDAIIQRLIEAGHYVTLQPQGVGHDTLLPLVAMGRGLALTSEATASISFPGIVYRPIVGETLTFSALWSAKNDNPALRRLLSMARSLARSSARCPSG